MNLFSPSCRLPFAWYPSVCPTVTSFASRDAEPRRSLVQAHLRSVDRASSRFRLSVSFGFLSCLSMGSCCSSLVPKYQQHLDSLLPSPTAAREVQTLGGVLDQADVTQWKMRASPGDMTSYARQMPEKLAPMANYLYRKIKLELQRGRLRSTHTDTTRGAAREKHGGVCWRDVSSPVCSRVALLSCVCASLSVSRPATWRSACRC